MNTIIKRERAILTVDPETGNLVKGKTASGLCVLTYSARDLEEDKQGRRTWKDVEISRGEFRKLLLESPYAHKMVPSTVLDDWVTSLQAPGFLWEGDWFINTILEDPGISVWCLHGRMLVASVGQLPGNVEISKKPRFDTILAYS